MTTGPSEKHGVRDVLLPAVAALVLVLLPGILPAQETGVRRALLIGIGDYAVNDTASDLLGPPDLAGPANDIALITRILTTRFAFRPENINTLLDGQANRAEILAALNAIVTAAGPGDIVYVHFSGVGARVKDTDGDERDGWDDTILPHDARLPGVADITDDEIRSILDGLQAASALVVLDAGHDPMPAAPGSDVVVRAAGQDERAELYASAGNPGAPGRTDRGADGAYVLVSAAAKGQFALESPIDGGPAFGWLSWSVARALGVVTQRISVNDAYDRVRQAMENLGIRAGLRAPAPVLVGADDLVARSVLGGDGLFSGSEGAATRAWVAAVPRGEGRVRFEQGALSGGASGSLWAIFPPGTSDFSTVEILATAEVSDVQDGDSLARVDGSEDVPEGSRAVLIAPPPPSRETTVWLRKSGSANPDAVRDAIRSAARTPLRFVDSARGARFIATIDKRGGRLFGPGGLQELARFDSGDSTVIEAMAGRIDRSSALAMLQALDNPSGSVRVRVGVNPIDVDGVPHLTPVSGGAPIPTFRVRKPGTPRAPDNSLMMFISVDRGAYITVIDVGPDGTVAPLFPNPVSDKNLFLPQGLLPEGTEVRIPDSLVGGGAGFYIDYEPPGGPDTLRVFASADPVTAQRLRDYLGRLLVAMDAQGQLPPFTEMFLPLESGPVLDMGTNLKEFGSPTDISAALPVNFVDWSATSVSFLVQE